MIQHSLLSVANERGKEQDTKTYCLKKDKNLVGETCVPVGVYYAIDSTGTQGNQGGELWFE